MSVFSRSILIATVFLPHELIQLICQYEKWCTSRDAKVGSDVDVYDEVTWRQGKIIMKHSSGIQILLRAHNSELLPLHQTLSIERGNWGKIQAAHTHVLQPPHLSFTTSSLTKRSTMKYWTLKISKRGKLEVVFI